MIRLLALICNYITIGFCFVAGMGLIMMMSESSDSILPGLMVIFLMGVTASISLVFIHQNKPADPEKESMRKELENLRNSNNNSEN